MNKYPALIFPLTLACAEPFAQDKHDLTEFRIAAMKQSETSLSASVWGEGLCHQQVPTYKWTQGDEIDDSVVASLQTATDRVELAVQNSEGVVRTGELSLGSVLSDFEFERVVISSDNLSLDERLALPELPFEGELAAGQALRIRAMVDEEINVQWMSAFGHGTVLELDAHTVDFYPERIEFEDGEVIERQNLYFEQYQILALAQDGLGGNHWQWLSIDMNGQEHLWSGGWALPIPTDDSNTGLLAVTLNLNEQQDAFVFENPDWVDDLSLQDHRCWETELPFQINWLLDGWCSCEDALGQRVVLEVEP